MFADHFAEHVTDEEVRRRLTTKPSYAGIASCSLAAQPALEILSVDRRAFGEYLQPASNPMRRPSRERHERDLRYRNRRIFSARVVRRAAHPAR